MDIQKHKCPFVKPNPIDSFTHIESVNTMFFKPCAFHFAQDDKIGKTFL